jgi:hypothetical protein
MAPTTGTALALLVAFVLPGFVVALFQERTFKQAEDLSPLNLLLRVLYYSVLCYVVLAAVATIFGLNRPWLEDLYKSNRDTPAVLVFYGAPAIFVPATIVWGWTLFLRQSGLTARIAELFGINTRHQQPSGWDYWFSKASYSYVSVSYKDGSSVWGYYGKKSFAAYSKDGGDLYLENVYHEKMWPEDPDPDAPRPGAWFGTAKDKCLGAWVKLDDAVSVEFYNFDPDEEPELSRIERLRKRAKDVLRKFRPADSAESQPPAGAGSRQGRAASSDEPASADAGSSDPAATG